jgi:hypothetical protein
LLKRTNRIKHVQVDAVYLFKMKLGKKKSEVLTACSYNMCNHEHARDCIKAGCSCCEIQDTNAMLSDSG